MNQGWKIRVQPAEQEPFVFKATFVLGRSGDVGALNARYLYGDGDLAVFLEDLGAGASQIFKLLETLQGQKSAEILLEVNDEALEVLARHSPESH